MGWMVGFEPTYTGATTLGLNHLTTPTILVFFAYGFVAARSLLAHVPMYATLSINSRFAPYTKNTSYPRLSFCVRLCRCSSYPKNPAPTLVFFALGFVAKKKKMAIRTGLEPVTSSVTGWHSNQLNYRTAYWWGLQGSNL